MKMKRLKMIAVMIVCSLLVAMTMPVVATGETNSVEDFVTRLYNVCLDRDPDEAGLNDWVNRLISKAEAGAQVAWGFVFSPEFTSRNLDNATYVEYLYKSIMGRDSDPDGKADWLNRMETQGCSREDVFHGFAGSKEFEKLCSGYGIARDKEDLGNIDEPGTTDDVGTIDNPIDSGVTEKSEISINETVLFDGSGVKITAKSFDTSDTIGPKIKLLIENNSGQGLIFQCRNASVNGYMVSTMMSAEVANGKKANDSLTFMSSSLEMCGIDVIADMEFSFHIFDSSSWNTYLDTELIQLKTSVADTHEYTYDDNGDLLYNGKGIKIVSKGLVSDRYDLGPGLLVYIENNSDKDIIVQARNESVNGFMISSIFSCEVNAGKKALSKIIFMDTNLEENGITEIENIEMYFHIFDSKKWENIVDTNVVSLNF